MTLVYNNITCLCVWAGVCSMGRRYRSNVHQTLIPGRRTRHSLWIQASVSYWSGPFKLNSISWKFKMSHILWPKFVVLWFIRLPEYTYYHPQMKMSTQVVAQLPVQRTLHCGFISQLGDVTGGFHISRTKSPPRHTTKFSIECAGGRGWQMTFISPAVKKGTVPNGQSMWLVIRRP